MEATVMQERGARISILDRLSHLLKHRKRLLLGASVIISFVASAVLAPVLAPYDPTQIDLREGREPPSREHLLGTDELGRDLLSRILYGGRVTLVVALVALTIATLVGSSIGILAGNLGGAWDTVLMRLMDVELAFPGIVLAIVIVAVVGPGLAGLIVSLAIFPIPSFARLSRALTLQVMEEVYIDAAKAVGVGRVRLVRLHVIPNVLDPLLVQMSVSFPSIVLIGSSLGFLGLGVQPPTPEWGVMLSRGRDYVITSPHMSIFPGAAVTFVVLGFTLFGDALRDMLDPHLRTIES